MTDKRAFATLASAIITALLVVIPCSAPAYVLEGPSWPAGTTVVLELGLGDAGRTLIDGNTSWNTAASPAFGMWNQSIQRAQLTSRNPTTGASSGDGINSIVFATTVFGQTFGPHTLAVTYYRYSGSTMSETDILFNQNQTFDSYRGPLRYGSGGYAIGDVRRVLVHELGHALGLNHPDDAGQNVDAVMNSMISNRETLASDDISGGQVLYGAPAPTPTPTPGPTPSPTPPPGPPTSTSIFWQNSATGGRQMWGMNGTAHVTSNSLGVRPREWNMMGSADFNADGQPDILWQNSSTRQGGIWIMHGAVCVCSVNLGIISPGWEIATAADFNGDGKSDIVWQNTSTGQRVVWIMNGAMYISSINIGVLSPAWEIVGSGDFNGDGKADILWQNSVTGQRAVWFMNGTINAGSVSLGTVATAWDIAGTGDFNHDGKPDILWQNRNTGQRTIWLMNRTAAIGIVNFGTVSCQWHIRNY